MKNQFTLLFLLIITLTFGQNEAFTSAIEKIKPELKTVENSKKNI
jgi:hypothetical protein